VYPERAPLAPSLSSQIALTRATLAQMRMIAAKAPTTVQATPAKGLVRKLLCAIQVGSLRHSMLTFVLLVLRLSGTMGQCTNTCNGPPIGAPRLAPGRCRASGNMSLPAKCEMQEEGLTGLEVFDPNHDGVVSFDELRTVLSRFAIGLSYESIDALTKQRGEPLWKFFGGAGTTLETDMTVTTGTATEAADNARAIRKRGIRMIKVKVGGKLGPAHDLERVGAISEVAPDSPLILDGNAGVSRAAASELVRGLKARGIVPALLEQWLAKDDLAGARALAEESGWLVAADESVTSADDARRVVAERAAGAINIKLMKGGVAAALDIVAVAKSVHRAL